MARKRKESEQQQFEVFQTDLVQVSQQVIASAQTRNRRAIFSQGLSEKGIEECIETAWYPRAPVAFDVPGVSGVKVLASPGLPYHLPDYSPYYTTVEIDVDQKLISISVTAQLSFVNPQNLREVYAYGYVMFTVTATPELATGASNTLQFKFRSAKIVLGPIYEVEIPARINALFGSVTAFQNKLTEIANKLRDRQDQFAGTLPAYVESMTMPDNWNQVDGYELTFVKMDYRRVTVDGTPVGYLFLVFSVKSLMLPVPCYCEETNRISDEKGAEQKLRKNRRSRLMAPFNEALLTVAEEEKRYGVISFSQEALAEITKPQVEIGQSDSVSTGGAIYGRAQYWYKTTLANVRVLQDGISASVAFTADGSVKAAVRDNCGNDVASASSKIRFRYDPSTVKWTVSLTEEPDPDTPDEKRKRLLAKASANMGRLTISIDNNVPPIDEIASWVTTKLVDLFDDQIERAIASKATFTLVTHDNYKNDYLYLELKAIQGIPDKSLHMIVHIRPIH